MVHTRSSAFSIPSLPSSSAVSEHFIVFDETGLKNEDNGSLVKGSNYRVATTSNQHSNMTTSHSGNTEQNGDRSSDDTLPSSHGTDVGIHQTETHRPIQLNPTSTSTDETAKFLNSNSLSSHDNHTTHPTGSSTTSTFLHELKRKLANDSHDILSIPDPPTPAQNAAYISRRRKRRQSSPIRRGRALQDETNKLLPNEVSKQGVVHKKTDLGFIRETENVNRRNKASRKSLCHIAPSVRLAPDKADSIEEKSTEPNSDSYPTESKEEDSVAFSNDICLYDDVPMLAPKKSKRSRRSIVLPRDNDSLLIEPKQQSEQYFMQLKSHQSSTTTKHVNDTKPEEVKPGRSNYKICNYSEVRQLVRSYCSTVQSNRNESQEAKSIEALTTYPIIPPSHKLKSAKREKEEKLEGSQKKPVGNNESMSELGLDWSSSPIHSRKSPVDLPSLTDSEVAGMKRNILLNIMSKIDDMDERKKADVEYVQVSTNCRVVKKGSKYKYLDLGTKRKVSYSEYTERYNRMLTERRASRVNYLTLKEERASSHSPSKNRKSSYQLLESAHCTKESMSEKIQPSSDLVCRNEIQEKGDEEILTSKTEENLVDKHIGLDLPYHDDIMIDVDAASNSDEGPIDDRNATTVNVETTNFLRLQEHPLPSTHQPPPQEVLLPLPSRCNASSNPAIAAAELKLWASIDAALATYSSEVMALQNNEKVSIVGEKSTENS